jgi:PAS domain S-box-containing protein
MGSQENRKKNTSVFRNNEKERLRQLTAIPMQKLSASDFLNLIQKLKVRLLVLEMRNEELLRIQEALEETRLKYFDLYDNAPVGYFTLDKNGKILDANLTGAGLLGIERSLMVNNPFSQYILKDYRDEFHRHHRKVLETIERQTSDIKLEKKNGDTFYAQLESIAVGDSEGNKLCRTAVIDITLRKLSDKEWEAVVCELMVKRRDMKE